MTDSWPHQFSKVREDQIIFNKNFVLLDIYDDSTPAIEDGILLILNLATRKRYWISKESLEEKFLRLIVTVGGELVDMDMAMVEETKCGQMKVGANQIEIKHRARVSFELTLYSGNLFIGKSET